MASYILKFSHYLITATTPPINAHGSASKVACASTTSTMADSTRKQSRRTQLPQTLTVNFTRWAPQVCWISYVSNLVLRNNTTIWIKRKSWFWWKLVKICRNMSKHRGCHKSSGQNGLRLLATCGVAIPNWQQYLFQDVPDWWFQSFHFGRWNYGSDWNDQSLSLDM